MTGEVECTVIGAGVIGLATARALALDGRKVMVLERDRHFGSHISARNSEVIHAGIYYPPGSVKALTCVAGRELLYRYCRERTIPHRRCGKYIVASSEHEATRLHALARTAEQNGVRDLIWLDGAQAMGCEPALSCVAALSSPSTGIIDSHAYMSSLLADAESHGAELAYGVTVSSMRRSGNALAVHVGGDPDPVLRSQIVINSAGLDAGAVAQSVDGLSARHIPTMRLAKGSYFTLTGHAPFSRLIYPVPEPGGLGIHMTLDLAGRARFGPDVEWIAELDYTVEVHRSSVFYPAIRRYWPSLRDGELQPAYAGIRPKLSGPGDPTADFCVSGPRTHGVPGLFNLFGIESPGLTASLALANEVAMAVRAQT